MQMTYASSFKTEYRQAVIGSFAVYGFLWLVDLLALCFLTPVQQQRLSGEHARLLMLTL